MGEARAEPTLPQSVGRYQIAGRIAEGGMAEILIGSAAGPSSFSRAVVIKRILPELARRSEFRTMFLDEARIVASIHHENVIQVHDLSEEDDELFLVMEYLQGESSAGLIRRLVSRKTLIAPEIAAYIVACAAAGLSAAHSLTDPDGKLLNVVHRDVSPENVFITYQGGVKLLDFGIAHAGDRGTKTRAGQLKGKIAYMSPEQCQSKPLDGRSDVFALGILLFELLTLKRLFMRKSDLDTLKAICIEPTPSITETLPDCPPDLERICARALQKKRRDRYQTAGEMRIDLLKAVTALNPGGTPLSDAIATKMKELFAARIASKQEMVRKIRRGDRVKTVAKAETDPQIVVPDAVEPAPGASTQASLMSLQPPARRDRSKVAAFVAVAVAGGAILGGMTLGGSPAELMLPGLGTIAADAKQSSDTGVTLQFNSVPAGATVTIDGKVKGQTPVSVTTVTGTAAISVTITADGFQTWEDSIVPEINQRIDVSLKPSAVARPSGTAKSKPSPRWVAPARPKPKPKPEDIYKL